MTVNKMRAMVSCLGLVLVVAGASWAADLDTAIKNTEGRRRAAENGLKEIKTKSAQPSEQIRAAYIEAAAKQNAIARARLAHSPERARARRASPGPQRLGESAAPRLSPAAAVPGRLHAPRAGSR
jgi:hypothetical protein